MWTGENDSNMLQVDVYLFFFNGSKISFFFAPYNYCNYLRSVFSTFLPLWQAKRKREAVT